MLLDLLFGGSDNIFITLLVLLISFPLLLISLSAHEFAHGYAAYKQGDGFAKAAGRLTLNPFKHLDPLGTLCMLLVGFGWAKPVPIVPSNFKHGKLSLFIVSIAGICANLFIAICAVFLSRFFYYIIVCNNLEFFSTDGGLILYTIVYGIFSILAQINICLAVFNFLPIPPLDGFKIFRSIFEGKLSYEFFRKCEMYSTWILLAFLILTNRLNIIGSVSSSILDGLETLIEYLFIAFK